VGHHGCPKSRKLAQKVSEADNSLKGVKNMGKETFDKSSVLDNLTGVEHVGVYDSDSNKVGEGVGSTTEEATERAETDLQAQEVAEKAQEYIDKNNE
jgi:hypothetical protein